MIQLVKKEFNGVEVSFKGTEEVNLTDLWRAAGSPENKNPYEWERKEGFRNNSGISKKIKYARETYFEIIAGKGRRNLGTANHRCQLCWIFIPGFTVMD